MIEPPRPQNGRRSRNRRTELWLLIAVAGVALAVRLIYLVQSGDNPTFARPVVDAATYHGLARDLAEKRFLGNGFFWQAFFYPFFLAIAYSVSGSSIIFAKVVQCLVGSGTCVATYLLGRELFGRRAGLIAAGIVAFYGPLIFFETELLATGWAALWSTLAVLLLVKIRRAGSARLCLALGVVGGLAVITRAVFLPPLAAGCVWLAVSFRGKGRRRLLARASLRLLGGFALIVVPLAALAWRQTGRPTFLPSSGGINLYIGNNPDAPETLTIRPGWRWKQLDDQPLRHGCRDQWQRQSYFRRRTLAYVTSEPVHFAAGLGRKALQLTNSREIPRNVDPYMFRRWSSLLSVLMWKAGRFGFPFGVLLPLAAMGLVLGRRRTPAVLWLFLLAYAGSVVLVFVAGRYRVPVVPLFAVLAGSGCVAAGEAIRRRQWPTLTLAGVCVLATAAVAAAPAAFREEKCNYEAELELYLGSYHQFEKGDPTYYVEHLCRARQLMPENSDTSGELGFLYLKRGDLGRAVEYLSEAVAIEPGNFIARQNLATALAEQAKLDGGRFDREKLDQAIGHYLKALESNPFLAKAHYNLAELLAQRGDTAGAVAHYLQALRIDPRNLQARYRLALVLIRLGRYDHAAQVLQEGVVMAERAGNQELAERFRKLLRLCKASRPRPRSGQ